MVRSFVDAEKIRDMDALQLERPEITLTYNHSLAFRAAVRLEKTGRLESPEEIAATDPSWESDVYAMLDYLKYHRDYDKRPPGMQI